MSDISNGLRERVNFHTEQIHDLQRDKASKESVTAVEQDVREIKESNKELRDGFRSLQVSILVGCVLWALGSAAFLVGVLQLTQ